MKNLSVFILGMMLFSFGMVSCKKDSAPVKTPEEIRQEQNDQVRNLLVGKWVRENLKVDGYDGDVLVDEDIDDPEILFSLAEFLPQFVEITKDRFIMIDAGAGENDDQSYTVDAEKGTLTITDDKGDGTTDEDITTVGYILGNNNQSLSLSLQLDESLGVYSHLKIKIDLKKVAEFPVG